MKNKKYLYLEAMRIIACFFVIFNHTGNNGFFLFSQRELGGGIILVLFVCFYILQIFCTIIFGYIRSTFNTQNERIYYYYLEKENS